MLEKYDDFELVPANSTKEARPLVEEDGGDTIKVADGTTVANATENATMIKVKVERERKRLHYISLKVQTAKPHAVTGSLCLLARNGWQVTKQVLGPLTPITTDIVESAIARNAELLRQEQARPVVRTWAEARVTAADVRRCGVPMRRRRMGSSPS